jgi:hypothetical protein
MFMSKEELHELTGFRNRPGQIRWLSERGYRFELDRSGRPVIICEQCPTLGTAGDIMLCDMSQYCVIDKGSIQEDWSIHIMYLYDESVYRAVFRADGQPLWSAAVTPFKGSSTISPFICLQTRS